MSSVPQLPAVLRTVLTTSADTAARATGFVQRRSKLTGGHFVQALTFGWLTNPDASLAELAQMAAVVGVPISPQGLAQRFSAAAAACLAQVLQEATAHALPGVPPTLPLLQRFPAVLVRDSTLIVLPDALAAVWRGCGGRTADSAPAALKAQVQLDLCAGGLDGPVLQAGRTQDRSSPHQTQPQPPGTLRIADLGFFSLNTFATQAAQDGYWLSRLQVQIVVHDPDGTRWDLLARLQAQSPPTAEYAVRLGTREQLPARLFVVRVPQEVADQRRRRLREANRGQAVSARRLALAAWTLVVTNVPAALLTLREALVLLRARWQIEWLFKLWKQYGHLATWRSTQPWRILCEVYAKLLGALIQQWCLRPAWPRPDRSLVGAARTVRRFALLLALAYADRLPWPTVLPLLEEVLARAGRLNPRRARPNTYQLLLDPHLSYP
jgi:Transposase DDE domain